MKYIPLAMCVVLSGCAENSANLATSSGATVQTARCKHNQTACFQQASAACPSGYTVHDSYRNMGGLIADIFPGPVTWFTIAYTCERSSSQGKTEFRFR